MKPTLASLIEALGIRPVALHGEGRPVSGITADSRTVERESVFVCMPSAARDTHEFLEAASAEGATAAVVHSVSGLERAVSLGLDAVQFDPEPLAEFFRAVALIAHEVLGQPSRQMKVIGITGTNGKTTTAWMIRDALRALGRKAAYMGTLGIDYDGDRVELANTTPFPVETAQLMAEAVRRGCTDFVMEASSHALEQNRVAGVVFRAGVFTNLTQDHLDFHGSMEAYESAKKRLFTDWAQGDFVGAVNRDDAVGLRWSAELGCPLIVYGSASLPAAEGAASSAPLANCLPSSEVATPSPSRGGQGGVGDPHPSSEGDGKLLRGELTLNALNVRLDTIDLDASCNGESVALYLSVGGLFNVQNAGSALAGLLALGIPLQEAGKALEQATAVPGRFQAIPNDQGIGVIVDYAHTPDALEQLIKSVRGIEPRRIITVFGCGGDRDRTKRPKMAAVVSRLSDMTVVTSDNPRTEDPQAILDEVLTGVVEGAESIDIIDRREAIFHAVEIAEPGDVVVIAGKGHEDYQIIGRTKHHMDDREMAAEALERRRR